MILAVVGSGGKTSAIKELAQTCRAQGKSVFVTTTMGPSIAIENLYN